MRFLSIKNRTFCDCLREIRDYLPHTKLTEKQEQYIMSLVEELQTYGNRMESAIYDYRDILEDKDHLAGLKREIRKAEGKLRRLEKKLKGKKK